MITFVLSFIIGFGAGVYVAIKNDKSAKIDAIKKFASRFILVASCMILAGCCWFDEAKLPEPGTNGSLSGAEASLDHLTDKRDSRVAAAVTVAREVSNQDAVKAELDVAQAMLPAPTPDDLKFAKDRSDKGDDKLYAEQIAISRALAASIIEANKKYEAEKAKKQAEYEARLKEKELALAAEQEARQADKWTYAGIGLVTVGLLALFLSPAKLAGASLALAGLVAGAFPILSRKSWFLPSLIGAVILAGLAAYAIKTRKQAEAPPQA